MSKELQPIVDHLASIDSQIQRTNASLAILCQQIMGLKDDKADDDKKDSIKTPWDNRLVVPSHCATCERLSLYLEAEQFIKDNFDASYWKRLGINEIVMMSLKHYLKDLKVFIEETKAQDIGG